MSVLNDYIRHIEELQDSLTKRNARIAQLKKLLDVYSDAGERRAENAKQAERDRIIRLIEQNFEEKTCSCTWDSEYPNCYEGEFEDEAITKVIALIKGESK